MSRVWKTKQELCELAARLRFPGGAGPQSASLQAEFRHARAFAWFDVLDDVIHLWVEEARVAALKPAEPITWDGSLKAASKIDDALPLGVISSLSLDKRLMDELYVSGERYEEGLELRRYPSEPGAKFVSLGGPYYEVVGTVPLFGSVRIEGDSFVILPPEVES